MIKYAVVIEPLSRNEWTEYMADSEQEAWERREFIEAHLRGVNVRIRKLEWGENSEEI